MKSDRYIAFDVETPNAANDRMSAIGITVIDANSITGEFYTLVDPETHFDRFNIEILDALLSQVTLRGEVSRSEVIETFRLYQDFINARFQMSGGPDFDLQAREQFCQRAVLTLLYGVIEPGEEENTHA